MNIIEWINTNYDAGDAMTFALIAFLVWFILWKILSRIFEKRKMYDLLELGAIGSFGILLFLSIIVVLFIASIQAIIEYEIKMLKGAE